jgi:hypothetical protein
MKVLIDECAPKALKVALAARGFDCTTVSGSGMVGERKRGTACPGRRQLLKRGEQGLL